MFVVHASMSLMTALCSLNNELCVFYLFLRCHLAAFTSPDLPYNRWSFRFLHIPRTNPRESSDAVHRGRKQIPVVLFVCISVCLVVLFSCLSNCFLQAHAYQNGLVLIYIFIMFTVT